jgi:hypothetical protein
MARALRVAGAGVGGVVLALAPAAGAVASGTSTSALQVRRTSAVGDATVDLAVLPRSATDVRVAQGGRSLRADTEPMVSARRPLGIVVQVGPAQLPEAQGLVADALATLPPGVRVRMAPLGSASGASGASGSAGAMDPSTALAGLDRLTADDSPAGLARSSAEVAGTGAARAVLVVTTCPGGQLPDVGSAGTTTWVLGWGRDCLAATPPASAARVVERTPDVERALGAVPAVVRQILAARSVRVVPKGTQPLVVTASGARGTVALAGAAAGRPVQADAGGRPPGTSAVDATTIVTVTALALAAALLALLLLRRRRAAAGALPVPTGEDDAWSRLVPEWTRAHGRHELRAEDRSATSPARSGRTGTRPPAHLARPDATRADGRRPDWARPHRTTPELPRQDVPGHDANGSPAPGPDEDRRGPVLPAARPELVIDLRHAAEVRPEGPAGSA